MNRITCVVNGATVSAWVEAGERAIDFLRERLHLTGTKEGCGQGECGSCTILVDTLAVHACMMLAVQLDGKEILTIEGLMKDGEPDRIQKAFLERGAVQCGYCTPGMIMSVKGLLLHNPCPTDEEIREAIAGNLCRCTGYQTIVDAVHDCIGKE